MKAGRCGCCRPTTGRVTPIAMATGHAAGVCAALAAHSGRIPRQVAASEVQRELLRQGASLRPGLDIHQRG
jgi:hypothetical protein